MTDAADPRAWVERAEEDYAVACASLRRKKPFVYATCFHAQQCVEKYLKAALIARGQAFPHTHDLLALDTLGAQSGILLGLSPTQLGILSSYAVRVRYPGEEPTQDEAAEAVRIARTVRRVARKWLQIK
jgi:HEPN domain-containing protein